MIVVVEDVRSSGTSETVINIDIVCNTLSYHLQSLRSVSYYWLRSSVTWATATTENTS